MLIARLIAMGTATGSALSGRGRHGVRLGAGMLLLLTLVSYGPAYGAGYIWDDDQYLTRNPLIVADGGLWRIWAEPTASPQYYPLVFSSFWAQYRLVGLEPASYHAVNVLLHAICAVLVWRLLARLGVPGALLAASLFAVHPVHVESVAWVTERKNVLSGALYLFSLLAFSRYAGLGGEPGESNPGRPSWFWVSWLAFLGALFSKTVTSSLPVVILLIAWWKRRLDRRTAGTTVPFFMAGAILGLHTAALEKYHVGAAGPQWDLSFVERVLIAGRAFWFYVGKLVYPTDLAFVYPRWDVDHTQPLQLLFAVAVPPVLVVAWLVRDRWGRGPLVAVLFYGVSLAPASGFFDVYPMQFSFVADHFQYLASLGPLALAAASLATAAHSAGLSLGARTALGASIVLALGTLTWQRSLVFRTEEGLWEQTLRLNPSAWMAANNLGGLLLKEGRADEAVPWLEQAVREAPELLDGRNNLGFALSRTGRRQEAIRVYQDALRVQPAYAPARYNLALSLAAEGDLAAARHHLEWVVRQSPADAAAWRDLGRTLALLDRPREALDALRRAVTLAPNDAFAANQLQAVEQLVAEPGESE